MENVSYELIVIFLLVLINGIFAMSEAALLSVRKVRLQHLAERGNAKARSVLELLRDPNSFLSTVQVGVTLVGVLSGAFGGATLAEQIAASLEKYPSVAPYSESIGIGVVVLLITYLSLVIGELVPKRLALHSPERIAAAVAKPMSLISRVGSPLVRLLSVSTNAVLWLFRLKESQEPTVTQDDVTALIRMGTQSGVFDKDEQQIVERVFRFGDRRISAIMTHRAEVAWLDVNDPPAVLRGEIIRYPYLRFPVCDRDLDLTLGIVSAKDYLAAGERANIREMLQTPVFVPEGLPALKVLERFRYTPVHIALVIDEYGGVEGLVSATDVLEALVGDLPGGSPAEQDVVRRPDGSWLVDGTLPIQDLKDLLNIKAIPHEDTGAFQTVAGLVIYHLGRIPRPADTFDFGKVHLEVVDMDGNRVDKVLVTSRDALGDDTTTGGDH
jgi:putative hemolysin